MRIRVVLRERAAVFGGVACLLAACSVDTSDLHFRPDREFEPGGDGGVLGNGGALNKAGKAGSGSTDEGGEDTGGSDTGGMPGGGVPPVGGAPGGGAPGGGVNGVGGNNGTAGVGGMPPVGGYPCTARVKPDRIIADFSTITKPTETWMDASNTVTFGLYAFPPNTPPAMTIIDGALVLEAKIGQPSGAGIWFAPCLDASGFTQLEFAVSGTRNDGQALALRVGVGTNDTKMIDPMNRTGTCMPPGGADPGYCRPPVTEVAVQAPTPPGMVVAVKFADLRNGSPVASLDASQLTQLAYVEWGFIYLNGQPAYDAKLTVDNVAFK